MNKNIFSLVTLVLALLLTFTASSLLATPIIVELRNGSNALITSGATLEYTPGGAWSTATSNGDGTWTISTSASSLYYRMTYNYGVQQIGPYSTTQTPITFQTTTTTVRLQKYGGAGLDGGLAHYTMGGTWHDIGLTVGGNSPVVELLPVSYYFDMDYNYGHQQLEPTAISGASQTVKFTTTATTVRLQKYGGAGLDGGLAHYTMGGTWHDIGLTVGGNSPVVELLPVSYYFDMDYNYGHQQLEPTAISGASQTVKFTTTATTVRLQTCSGTGLDGGLAHYTMGGTWHDIGLTVGGNSPVVELLPVSYYFDMDYNFGHQQLVPLTISGAAQTVPFQTTAVTFDGSGLKEYTTGGSWHTFTNPVNLLPGSYYFRIGGTQLAPIAVSGCTFYRAFVTVELRNGSGGFIVIGGSLKYYDGSWKTDAVDNHNGTFSVIASAPSLYYEMAYNYAKQQIGPLPGSTSLVKFQTTTTTVRLENAGHTGLPTGVARFYQNSWQNIGPTNGSGNAPPVELLPGNYYFDMDYNVGHQQVGPSAISGDDPHNQTVIFTTTATTVRLETSAHLGLNGGAARYYQRAWTLIGNTGAGDGNAPVVELLPGSYYFDMDYNYGHQQLPPQPISGNSQTVTFTTTATTVRLETSAHLGLNGGAARYYQRAWTLIGNTGAGAGDGNAPVVELLPGSYYFDMDYNHGHQQVGLSPVSGASQTVTFKTTATTVRLQNHDGNGIDVGTARFYQRDWNSIGQTAGGNAPVVELLPGSYYFDMDYNYGHQQLPPLPISGNSQTVTFQTTTTTVRLENCSHTGLNGGVARYYQSAWKSFGTTGEGGTTGNTFVVELLPGSYYFDMDFHFGHQQLPPQPISGNSQTVTFQTTTVTISGTGTTPEYYQSAWHPFLTSPTDLLPGNYYFRVGGNQVGPFAISGCTFNGSVVVITLQNHLGVGIAGGVAQWYNGSSWVNIGTTPSSGKLVAFVNPTGVYYNMKYNNATQQVGSFNARDYTFQTTQVSLNLKNHSGGLITASDAGTAAGYYGPTTSTWYDLGGTGSNGYVRIELLPVSGYYFNMTYKNVLQQQGPMSVGPALTQDVNFQTTEVSINLNNHLGTPIAALDAGTAGYYSPTTSTWYNLGGTGINGYVKIELLPVPGYYFKMNYNNVEKQLGPPTVTVGSGPTQNVDFQTTQVSLNLKNHDGALITGSSGTAGYYSPTTKTWYDGSTGGDGYVQIELLQVSSYYFRMTYNNVLQQLGPKDVGAGPKQDVDFKTTLVSLNLKDHTGALITTSSGTAGYYSPTTKTWYDGSTGGDGYVQIELLQVSGYYFRMTYNNALQQLGPKDVGAGPAQDVDFQTGKVTQGSLACTQYYFTAWHAFSEPMELLPGFYWFRFASGPDKYLEVKAGLTLDLSTGLSSNLAQVRSERALEVELVPTEFGLRQNYPNPFNPTTTITYALPVDATVNVQVYDISGRSVAKLVESRVNAGYHSVVFNASGLASGLYFYRMTAKGDGGTEFALTQKMVLLK